MVSNMKKLWKYLEIDIDNPVIIEASLPIEYQKYFYDNIDRPKGMRIFDAIISTYGSLLLEKILNFQINGGKLVGTYCAHIPDELIFASGAIPIALCSENEAFIQGGEQFLPVNTCPLVKASIGARMTRACPYAATADLFIAETSCDAKTKAWEILNTDANIFVINLPKKNEYSDYKHYLNEINSLRNVLENLTGNIITDESLFDAIKILNNQKKAINRMWNYRKLKNVPISGRDCLLVQRAAKYISPIQYSNLVNNLCDELDDRLKENKTFPKSSPRIMITGSPIGLQSYFINQIIERAGGIVVVEETCGSTRVYEKEVKIKNNTLPELMNSLTEKYFGSIHCACFTPNNGRIQDIIRFTKEYSIDGVIDVHLKFCQIFDIEHYVVEKVLEKNNIPCMGLEVDYGDNQFGQIETRVEAFMEMI